jgi:photosystem II stability/assembly factor-like uncharacterized protein
VSKRRQAAGSKWFRFDFALLALLGFVGAVVAAAFLWDSSDGERAFTGVEVVDPGPIHVHGLGIDPGDGSLYIATHTGLWRVARDKTKAERVTDRRQDTMGFSVAASDRFLGSGHPDLRESMTPLLGLIESRDRGQTWENVSLLGKADFHILRAVGRLIYGFDSTSGRLFVSRDGGHSWVRRKPPEPLLDLVPDPQDASQIVASGETRLYRSRDAGKTWDQLGAEPGYLAWPAEGTLLRIGGRGDLWRTTGPGGQWKFVSVVGGQPAAFLAVSARELYAALHDSGLIKQSTNAGKTWQVRSRP